MKVKFKLLAVLRFIVQAISLVFLPGIFIMVFSGMKQIYVALINGDFSLFTLYPQLIAAITVIPFTMLLGRFFCGWMCAFGSMGEWLYALPRLLKKKRLRKELQVDRYLKFIKYIVLTATVIFLWTIKINIPAISPWDAFAQLPDFNSAIQLYAAGSAVLLLIIIGSIFIERFYCRYLCPLGAFFTIISRLRILKINKPTLKCGKCRICTSACPMGIPLYKYEKVKTGECIGCARCVEVCPRKNAELTAYGEGINPVLASAIAIVAITGLYSLESLANDRLSAFNTQGMITTISSNNAVTNNGQDSANSIILPESSQSSSASSKPSQSSSSNSQASSTPSSALTTTQKYKDGTYTGIGTGYRPNLSVTVTITSGKISSIQIGSNRETPSFANMPFNLIPKKIISSQSSKVDAVSGATRTSSGIMEAVSNALSKAAI